MIPQEVRSRLLAGKIGNVRRIGCPAFLRAARLRDRRRDAKTGGKKILHEGGITRRKIVVGRDHMAPFTAPTRHHRRQTSRKRLAFTCGHFHNAVLQNAQRPRHLALIGFFAANPVRRFAYHSQSPQGIFLRFATQAENLTHGIHFAIQRRIIQPGVMCIHIQHGTGLGQ